MKNKMINCIALDDEPLALSLMADNISKVPFLHLIATCDNAFEASEILRQHPVDLIFTDIQMPGMTGLQFIHSLVKKPMVILVTAYKQYALESYNLDVIDYLLKPVAIDRFMKACNKAQELYQLKNQPQQDSQTSQYIFLNAGYSMQKVIFDDIVWVEGLRDYIQIHLKRSPKPLVVRMSIKAIEELLPAADFMRIHKSYLISVAAVTAIRRNSVFLNDKELSVGDTYGDVIEKLMNRAG